MKKFVEYAGEIYRVRLHVSGKVIVERRTWNDARYFGIVDDKFVGSDGCRFAEDDPLLLAAQSFYASGDRELEVINEETERRFYRPDTPYDWFNPPAVVSVCFTRYGEDSAITATLVWDPEDEGCVPRLEDTSMVYGLRAKVLPIAIELAAGDEVDATW